MDSRADLVIIKGELDGGVTCLALLSLWVLRIYSFYILSSWQLGLFSVPAPPFRLVRAAGFFYCAGTDSHLKRSASTEKFLRLARRTHRR